MKDLIKKALDAFSALSPEEQAGLLRENRKSFAEFNVALSRTETLDDILRKEAHLRAKLNVARNTRRQADERVAGFLLELQAAKREAYALGFKGNIMRDENGERVNKLPE